MRNIEDQKKSVVAEFGSQITIAKEQIGSLSNKVSSGYEMRDTTCMVRLYVPEPGKKTLTRTDTGEEWVEPMNDTDHNLFSRWEESERERLESEQSEIEAEPNVEDYPDGLPDEDLAMDNDGEYAEDDVADKFSRAANSQFKKQA